MDTLRSFVDAFLEPGTFHSKPDTIADSYELRRLKLRRVDPKGDRRASSINARWPETDFYEYYWAHHMYGTTISHVTSWLWRVLSQSRAAGSDNDPRYDKRLKRLIPVAACIATAGIIIYAAVVMLLVRLGPTVYQAGVVALALGLLWSLVWPLIKYEITAGVVDFVGDCARYFDVNPKNVARRYDILRGGVDMLKYLHEERDTQDDAVMYRYGRVVLIGHSLGSVIAYDILRHYWYHVNGRIHFTETEAASCFRDVENFAGSNHRPDFEGARPYHATDQFRRHQYDTWRRVSAREPSGVSRSATGAPHPRWIVTDLVTLGCPMTYAPVLLTRGVRDLDDKVMLRELPTCPPDRSRNMNPGHFTVHISAEADVIENDFHILSHGALFALTRWTNIFFDNDPIGGPVAPVLGNGIDDVSVKHGTLGPFGAHISYWDKRQPASRRCRARLRRILTQRAIRCAEPPSAQH